MEGRFLLSFSSTHDAISAEQALVLGGFAPRVMPLPSAIAAGCGLCLRLPETALQGAKACLSGAGITPQGLYKIEGGGYSSCFEAL